MVERLLKVETPTSRPRSSSTSTCSRKAGTSPTSTPSSRCARQMPRTSIEQSIGRGLRLPYGKRTGVAAVDRLNIVAHDKFQEIVDEANRGDSPIRLKQVILDAPSADDKKVSVQVEVRPATASGLDGTRRSGHGRAATANDVRRPRCAGAGVHHRGREAGRTRVYGRYRQVRGQARPGADERRPAQAEVQKEILAEVTERLKPNTGRIVHRRGRYCSTGRGLSRPS